VEPGEYVVALRVGDTTLLRRVVVLPWPEDRRGRIR
jgi:hypothetical protein